MNTLNEINFNDLKIKIYGTQYSIRIYGYR